MDQSTPKNCVACRPNCLSCDSRGCTICSPGFLISAEGNCYILQTRDPTCHASCKSCLPTKKNSCLTCNDPDHCIGSNNRCSKCPATYTNNNDPLQDAVMTFNLVAVDERKLSYKITFSESRVTVLQPYSFSQVELWAFIYLEGYRTPEDFSYTVFYEEQTSTISV